MRRLSRVIGLLGDGVGKLRGGGEFGVRTLDELDDLCNPLRIDRIGLPISTCKFSLPLCGLSSCTLRLIARRREIDLTSTTSSISHTGGSN